MTYPGLVGPVTKPERMQESPPLCDLYPACRMVHRHVKQFISSTKWLAHLSSEKGVVQVNDNTEERNMDLGLELGLERCLCLPG